jgi:hypothetical protein
MTTIDGGDCKICCCCVWKGGLRYLYRERGSILLNAKTWVGFIEMFAAMLIMFTSKDDVCVNIRFWLLAWIIRIPLELPLVTEVIEFSRDPETSEWVALTFLSLLTAAGFAYGNVMIFKKECKDSQPGIYWGLVFIISLNYLFLFTTWPIVSILLHRYIGNLKPILPHLPHYRFAILEHKLGLQQDGTKEKCVICMNKFHPNHVCTQLSCEHFYHQQCINTWLESKNTCPMCRTIVPDDGWQPPASSRMEQNYNELFMAEVQAQSQFREEENVLRAIEQSRQEANLNQPIEQYV